MQDGGMKVTEECEVPEEKSVNEILKNAFTGESKAYMKYLGFAQQAEEEGEQGIAKIFRTAAKAEKVHALNQMAAQGWVPPTEENLEEAIEGETDECTNIYPEFIEIARDEKRAEAVQSFKWVKRVEETHKEMFEETLDKLKSEEEVEDKEYYVCMNCGYPEKGAPPKTCPVCGAPKKVFEEVE